MLSESYFIHIVKSFGLHIVFGVVLALSFSFAPTDDIEEIEQPEELAIDAVVIDEAALTQQVQDIKRKQAEAKAAEEKRVKDLEARADRAKRELSKLEKDKSKSERAAEEAKRKAAAEKIKADKAQKERKKREQEAEKARKDALAAKRKKDAEEKAAADAKRKKEAEQKALEEAKAQAEKERKDKERKEREAKERALQEKLIQEQLAKEQAARNKVRQKHILTEKQKYTALIMGKIQQNLIVNEQMKGKSCRLNIKVAFSGLVTKVTVLSGDNVVCQAAQRAVWKSETLPVSKEADVFQELKSINLTVEPEL